VADVTTPTPTIDATGIHIPDFNTVLLYFINGYKAIYGSDVYLGNDSQDGQLLGLFATAVDDCNSEAVAVYNSFRPGYAQGMGLSSVVKINGIHRMDSSFSTVDVDVVGVVGTLINGGSVRDANNNAWLLPATVIIPMAGVITVTATAEAPGNITLGTGITLTINTPQLGWQSATTSSTATPGRPIESDAALRQRQTLSTALPSLTVLDGIIGALAAIPGVVRQRTYENDTDISDSNGIPPHSISVVIDGGDAQTIANTIGLKKTPGAGTYGTTSETYTDPFGIAHTIHFYRPTEPPIAYILDVHALTGFTTVIQAAIQASLAAWTNALGIGNSIQWTRAFSAAYLSGLPAWMPDTPYALHDVVVNAGNMYECTTAGTSNINGPGPITADQSLADGTVVWQYILSQNAASQTFEVTLLEVGRDAAPPAASDVTIAFNEAGTMTASDVTINLV
jgi:uncharacterized phage protein gp47/JayE